MRRRAIVAAVLAALGLLLWLAWGHKAPVPNPLVAKRMAPNGQPATGLHRPDTFRVTPLTPRHKAPTEPPPHGVPTVVDTGTDEVAEVNVRVVDPRGHGGRMRPRCNNVAAEPPERVSETTTLWRFTANPGACAVQGMRKDGSLPAWTEEVNLDLVAGQSYDVVLELPAERTGGLGVSFEPVSDGMRVTRVIEGTPAEGLGLQVGDVIIEVDGLPTPALSGVEFQQVLAGPEGTAVRFLVDHGDGDGPAPYEIVRSFVER